MAQAFPSNGQYNNIVIFPVKLTNNNYVIDSRPWRFFDFNTDSRNKIEDWRSKELSFAGRQKLKRALQNCSTTNRIEDWLAFKRFIKGGRCEAHNIWELQFRADKKEYRLLGVFHPDEKKSVILLMGCSHKGSVYTPADAIDQAGRRADQIKRGEGRISERDINAD